MSWQILKHQPIKCTRIINTTRVKTKVPSTNRKAVNDVIHNASIYIECMLVALVTGHKLVTVVSTVMFQRGTPELVWPCLMKPTYRKHCGRSKIFNPKSLRAMSIQTVETSPGWIGPRGSSSKVEIIRPNKLP